MKKDQYVVVFGDDWAVSVENNSKVTKIFKNKEDAIEYARDIAKNQKSELRVQNSNGKFGMRNSYGNDPCPPKDKNR